jgi:hypothetical protein
MNTIYKMLFKVTYSEGEVEFFFAKSLEELIGMLNRDLSIPHKIEFITGTIRESDNK